MRLSRIWRMELMLIPGLCSVTFRSLQPLEICKLAAQAQLKSIEWGGDVHVTDEAKAREVARISADYGLTPASFGSYFRAGAGKLGEFEKALDCALALGAGNIRVWAGTKGSAQVTGQERAQIIAELRECGELALAAGISVSLEFHGNTLTDCNESAGRLVTELGPCNVYMYWQPRWDWTAEQRLGGLMIAMQRLTHLHVFTWEHRGAEVIRHPLADGREFLSEALRLATQDGNDHHVFMEFVENADEQAFLRDARVLNEMLAEIN